MIPSLIRNAWSRLLTPAKVADEIIPIANERLGEVAAYCAGKPITNGEIDQLQHNLTLGVHYHEQLEALAANCCELLGIDPQIDSIERDWANEIVFHHQDPAIVIDQINRRRKAVQS